MKLILLILSVFVFLLAVFNVNIAGINMLALGLALFASSFLPVDRA